MRVFHDFRTSHAIFGALPTPAVLFCRTLRKAMYMRTHSSVGTTVGVSSLGDIEGGGALVMGVAGSQRVGVFQGMGWNGRCGGATRAPACIGQLRGMLRIAPPRWQGPLALAAPALSRPLPSATAAWRGRTRSTARAVTQAAEPE